MLARKLTHEPFSESTALVCLVGEWDYNGNEEFADTVANAVAGGRTRLVVDLAAVEHLDSSMLGSMLGLQKMAEANGWSLCFVRPREERVWRLFELTALAQRFRFFDARADALMDADLSNRPG